MRRIIVRRPPLKVSTFGDVAPKRFNAASAFVYAGEVESGELKIDDESKEASWVSLMSAVELPLAESQRRRLKDVVEYQKERQTFLR
jgi:ADP-ribose pyrophosphatase YjhB (NUDIX family)